MVYSLRNVVDAIDRLDWTAAGGERWLANATIAALGLLTFSVVSQYSIDPSAGSIGFLLGPTVPLALSAVIIGAAVWLAESRFRRYTPLIAFWCVGGGVVLGAIGQLVVLSQQVIGATVGAPLFVMAYIATCGAAVGLVVGVYDAGLRETQRNLNEQRERAERLTQQLSVLNRVLRHDVRTGVQIIDGYAEMLSDPADVNLEDTSERIREVTSDMHDTAETARELQRLLADTEHPTAEVTITDRIGNAVELVRAEHPEAQIELAFRDEPTVVASRIIDLAFQELLTNAIEHNANDRPAVEIGCHTTPEHVVVQIADDGPGIPQSELEPLRLSEETGLIHSSGIGLWLAKWVVEGTDGTLEFAHNELGGTTVTIRLPR